MENKNLKNGIDEIKKIVMTDAEKKRMFDNILNISKENKKAIKSPWSFYSFISITKKSQLVYYIIIPLIIIFSSGGVVFASQASLPDSILYPLKVKVIEPIEGALTFSPKAKAKHESSLASKRLVEAETLVEQGKLDVSSEKKINNLLATHTKSLSKALVKVNDSNSSEETDEIVTNFRAEMNAHAKVLDSLRDDRDNSEDNSNKNKDREENKNKEKNRDKEDSNDKEDIKISNTARFSAEKIKNDSSKKEKNNIEEYKEKKEKIESLISDTDIDISSKIEKYSDRKDFVTEDTKEIIDQAKAYLFDANEKGEEGDLEEAYSSLLDSESSIKEANILIKKGLESKDKKDRRDNNDDKDKEDRED